jgi:hypothetical protein
MTLQMPQGPVGTALSQTEEKFYSRSGKRVIRALPAAHARRGLKVASAWRHLEDWEPNDAQERMMVDQLRGIEEKGWLAASNSTIEGGIQYTLTTSPRSIYLISYCNRPSHHPYTIQMDGKR